MNRRTCWFGVVTVLVLLLTSFPGAQRMQAAPQAHDDVEAHITNAESAAPAVIAQDATIMGWDDEESVAEFREGGGSRFRAVFFVGG